MILPRLALQQVPNLEQIIIVSLIRKHINLENELKKIESAKKA